MMTYKNLFTSICSFENLYQAYRLAQHGRNDRVAITSAVPEVTKGGNWDTGYNRYEDDWFIFANIGIPGRTGQNYNNEFVGDELTQAAGTRSWHQEWVLKGKLFILLN